jgi:hypothetical protein
MVGITGHSYKAQIDPAAPVTSQLAGNGRSGIAGSTRSKNGGETQCHRKDFPIDTA